MIDICLNSTQPKYELRNPILANLFSNTVGKSIFAKSVQLEGIKK